MAKKGESGCGCLIIIILVVIVAAAASYITSWQNKNDQRIEKLEHQIGELQSKQGGKPNEPKPD